MTDSVGDISKKYIKFNHQNLDNSFINQLASFDKNKINKDIKEFEIELKKQQILANKFKNTDESKQMLDTCKKFIKDNSSIINKQHSKIFEINNNLKELIVENKKNAEINKELKELINSENYTQISSQMRELKSTISELKNFLVEEGITDF